MKARAQLLLGFAVSAHLALFAPGQETPAVKSSFITRDTPESAEVRRLGDQAINHFGMALVREVATTLARSGPEGAVPAMHLRELPLKNGTVDGQPRITAFKATSLRLRSQNNAPDEGDRLALAEFKRQIEWNGSPPPILVQRVELPPAAPEWRVYKPVGTLPQCLACHGDTRQQSPGLRDLLRAHYPDDEASDHAQGSWRGILRVTVADAP
jgi:hypothetical protein